MVWTAPSAPCRRQRGAQAPIVYVQCALRGLAVRSRGIARRWPQGHLVLSCKHLGASPVPALALTLSPVVLMMQISTAPSSLSSEKVVCSNSRVMNACASASGEPRVPILTVAVATAVAAGRTSGFFEVGSGQEGE